MRLWTPSMQPDTSRRDWRNAISGTIFASGLARKRREASKRSSSSLAGRALPVITRSQAIDLFRSDDLLAIGREADTVRRKLHPDGVVSYIIDRNINYTNFCTEYCSFCAFYRPMGHAEGYILPLDTILDKIQETVDLGGTGILMQGGLHPDLKIEWYEDLLRSIKKRFDIWCHCFSAPEIVNIAEVSGISIRDTLARLRDAGLDSIPGGGAEILDDDVRRRISRLKCTT